MPAISAKRLPRLPIKRPIHRQTERLVRLLTTGLLLVSHSGTASRAAPSEAEEEANCQQVSRNAIAISAPVQQGLERLAQQRYGRSYVELTPEQMMQLAMTARMAVPQITSQQQAMEQRCTAYQQRVAAKQSAAAGFGSLLVAEFYLGVWGREWLDGLGCNCPGYKLAGEDVDASCPVLPSCPGQQGGPKIPDPARGCRSLGGAAWIRQQVPDYYRLLGVQPDAAELDVRGGAPTEAIPSACARQSGPAAPPLNLASLASSAAPASPAGSTYAPAISAAAACFQAPTAPLCQQALDRGDALILAAKRAGRDRCLGYALTARTLWALGADPDFTDLLIQFPEASRLRNEARIALRYLRVDCRGL